MPPTASRFFISARDEILQRLAEQGFEVREEIKENEWIALAVTS